MIGVVPRRGPAGVSDRAGWTDRIGFYMVRILLILSIQHYAQYAVRWYHTRIVIAQYFHLTDFQTSLGSWGNDLRY